MNILLIPATDWLRHPVTSRQHHIFEIMAETDTIHVVQFDLYPRNIPRKTNVIIHRLPKISTRTLLLYYLLNLFPFWRIIIQIIKSQNINVVVVSNLIPGIPLLFGHLGCRIVFDLKDMFSDNSAIYFKNVVISSIIRGVSEWLQRRLLKNADHVITVSQFLMRYLRDIGVKNMSLIENGVDLKLFKPYNYRKKMNLTLKKSIEECKIIGFVGTIDRWIDFETVFKSLKVLSTRITNVKLLIVGGKMVTDYYDEIKSYVIKAGLHEKVLFTGTIPHHEVPNYINLMDVCLIPMKEQLRLNQARCPDKLFEYFACGKPVASTRLSEVLRIGRGVVQFYSDDIYLTKILEEVLNDYSLQKLLSQSALNISKHYDWRRITEKYRNIILANLANRRSVN